MKLSEIKAAALGDHDVATLYKSLNDTRVDYPSDKNIVSVFREAVKANPSKVAVRDQVKAITYEQLNKESDRIAAFLLGQQYGAEEVVVVYLNKTVEMIIALMGILKAGLVYCPVNTEYPYDRVRYMLNEVKARMVITEKAFIANMNKMQWECGSLDAIFCIDSDNIYMEEEPRSEFMNKAFWEYIGLTAQDDIGGGGWVDSYTGKPFSREIMDEYKENVLAKLQPFLSKEKKVLEIGCASGITMFRIAPFVKEYYGTDLSQVIIDSNKKLCEERNIDNIYLHCLEAENIDQLNTANFDIIIINSVIQAFNGHNYLRKIIRKAIHLLAPEGILFLGDIMDQDLKDALIADIYASRNSGGDSRSKVDFSGELFVSRRFFDDLRYEFHEIADIQHSAKIHTMPCELTRFRYDTIIQVGKEGRKEFANEKCKKQFDASSLDAYAGILPPVTIPANRLAYIIFTSGSTGTPKGVQIEHGGVLRAVKNINYATITPDDVWLQTCNISFDASCLEIFGALLNGCTLCLIPMEVLLNIDRLATYLSTYEVSIVVLVTPLFHELTASRPSLFANVKTLLIGGDTISPKVTNAVRKACPGVNIVNVYGPTENVIVSTTFAIEEQYNTIPIGKPVSNTRAYIISETMQLQPVGLAGELCVAGDGLARGYLNDKELTEKKFVQDVVMPGERMYMTGDRARLNADGNIEFLGRKDTQVKVRGNRIELFEIEQALLDIPEVENAVVVAVERINDTKVICAYLKLTALIDTRELKNMLARRLPHYMIPSYFITLDSFPLNANNKVDKKALPSLEAAGYGNVVKKVAPKNDIEDKVANVWKSVLDNQEISILDNFFEIGGDSLRLIRAFNKLNEIYPGVLQVGNLFDSPTIEKQAMLIQRSINRELTSASEYMVMKF